jgi:hypothetical protein
MTTLLMIVASLILLVLILWRGRSPDFRRRSEYPKFRFLANLGVSSRRSDEDKPHSNPTMKQDPDLTPKEPHEEHEP